MARTRTFISLLLMMWLVIAAPVAAQESTPDSGLTSDANAACIDSRLRIRDLKSIDDTIEPGVKRATEEAQAWQKDSRLYTLRLGCPLLVTGVKWEGVFFSQSAQAFYETDTGKVEPVEVDPSLIPTLATSTIKLSKVYDALIAFGFTDDLLLTASGGVTIKENISQLPFGPPSTSRDTVYAHIAVEQQDVIVDVWVSLKDYSVLTYEVGN